MKMKVPILLPSLLPYDHPLTVAIEEVGAWVGSVLVVTVLHVQTATNLFASLSVQVFTPLVTKVKLLQKFFQS